eukprot:TRINITY_DN14710_c0_g1_i5.p1 TRINITY_DN14710_c0_g1~~TRINITY_DN14710_c0_g1_i5.p1  ORF type:complete len:490 (+),score=18.23 TRINITY_DN14710_c0_g1_i5:364-1833(+)
MTFSVQVMIATHTRVSYKVRYSFQTTIHFGSTASRHSASIAQKFTLLKQLTQALVATYVNKLQVVMRGFFCNNQDGCGEGCQEYIDGLPYQNVRDVFFPDIPIPYVTFGQYGNCQGTRWPRMMCSLRAVSDSENPQTVQSDQNEWVSGILNPSQDCQGHSWAVCDICQSAYDIDACYQCASQVPVGEQQHCGKCSALSSTALQRRCIECLKAGSEDGCGQCVNLEEEYIKACFECSLGEEDIDVQNGCFACWAYGEYDPDCVQKCVKAAEVPGHAKQECGWCDLSDIGTQRCFQCLQESAESPTECWRCSAEECFSCLSEFSLNTQGRQGCISCTDRNKADCYKCVSDSNVPDYAKKLCGKVEYAGDFLARRNAHYNCLAGAPTTEAAEMCFYCSLTDENAERCYECSTILNAARKDTEYCTRCARENTEDERNVCYECVEYEGLDVELIPQCFKCLGYRLPGEGIEKAQECIDCLFNAATVEEADDCF